MFFILSDSELKVESFWCEQRYTACRENFREGTLVALLLIEQKVQECDATMNHRSKIAGL